MKEADVVVLGGGISGLTAGFLLKKKGYSVAVLDAAERPGGSITTWRKDGFLFELGPNTVLNNAFEIDQLCEEVRIIKKRIGAAPAAKKRFVVKRGALVPLPAGPLSFLTTRLFSMRAKLRLLKEPFIARASSSTEESIAAFTQRRLGNEFLQYAVGPFVSGVYAGDPEKLSVQHATAKIYALEERYGSLIRGAIAKRKGPAPAGGLFSFPRGLDTLPRSLAKQLGEGWCPGMRVEIVKRKKPAYVVRASGESGEQKWTARSVVSALPADAAASALTPLGGGFPAKIPSLPYADVALACLGFRRDQVTHPLDGFGFLAPEVESRHVLGCLFPSSLFPDRAPPDHVALTAFVGGAMHPERVGGTPDAILAATLNDLRPLLGLSGEPVLSRVEIWKPAIPQYHVGHGELKKLARSFEQECPGVFVSGNLLYGISVGDCIRNATDIAARVAKYLEVTSEKEAPPRSPRRKPRSSRGR